jgi:hypothetical protein
MENENKELRELLNRALECLDKQKQPFKDGDVVVYHDGSAILKIVNLKEGSAYGLNNNKWTNDLDLPFNFNGYSHLWKLSTPEKWLEVCTNEAVKRGLVEGAKIDRSVFNNDEYYNLTLLENVCPEWQIFHNGNTLECYGKVIMRNGIWAEVMKDKTLEELGFDYWNNESFKGSTIEWIKANPEAYIKAIQNLKK